MQGNSVELVSERFFLGADLLDLPGNLIRNFVTLGANDHTAGFSMNPFDLLCQLLRSPNDCTIGTVKPFYKPRDLPISFQELYG